MTIALYGISNCDTVKKARAWLDAAAVDHAFHDYTTAGAPPAKLAAWASEGRLGSAAQPRRHDLPPVARRRTRDLYEAKALALMAAHPSAIKRPVVEHAGGLLVGFAPERYAAALG